MDKNLFCVLTDMELALPVYIASVGGWRNQEPMRRENGYADFQWIQCVDGEGMLETEGRRHAVGRGQGMLLFPHRFHHYYPVKEPWEVRWITFNGRNAADLLASLQFRGSQLLCLSNPDSILKKIHEAFRLLQSKDPLRSVEGSSLVYQILLDLYTYSSPSEVRSKRQHYEQLSPVLAYIEDHYAEPLTLDGLAGELGLSPQYTCQLFQKTLGLRPFEYINRCRLRKAKELLLQQPQLDVKRVALQVGYEHTSYFIKLFKQQEGVTPSVFRRIHGMARNGV